MMDGRGKGVLEDGEILPKERTDVRGGVVDEDELYMMRGHDRQPAHGRSADSKERVC